MGERTPLLDAELASLLGELDRAEVFDDDALRIETMRRVVELDRGLELGL